jgi:ribonuclease Z
VDCGGDVVLRMMSAGINLDHIEALIVTHEHADHAGGFPLFMQKIWLARRRRPLPVYGPRAGIDQARRAFDTFNTEGWEGLPEREWHEVPLEEGTLLLESDDWRITASPGDHSVPVIALRVEDRRGGGIVTYSCDTRPSDAVRRLAEGADILVHEATGGEGGHTSAPDAARIARDAGAGRLLLVHLPPEGYLDPNAMQDARAIFENTEKGEEMGRYEF